MIVLHARRFLLGHAVATTFVWVVSAEPICALCRGLLALAVVTNQGLGGPLALPFAVVFTALAAITTCLVILLPATTLAARLCRARGWSWACEAPLSALAVGGALALVAAIVCAASSASFSPQVRFVCWLALLPLLAVHWACLRATDGAIELALRIWRAWSWRATA